MILLYLQAEDTTGNSTLRLAVLSSPSVASCRGLLGPSGVFHPGIITIFAIPVYIIGARIDYVKHLITGTV